MIAAICVRHRVAPIGGAKIFKLISPGEHDQVRSLDNHRTLSCHAVSATVQVVPSCDSSQVTGMYQLVSSCDGLIYQPCVLMAAARAVLHEDNKHVRGHGAGHGPAAESAVELQRRRGRLHLLVVFLPCVHASEGMIDRGI